MTIGTTLDATDIERALQTTLQTWVPSIVAELARRKDPVIPPDMAVPPRTWTRLPDAALLEMVADQSPMVAVTGEGMVEPTRDADGYWSAKYIMAVYVVVRASTFLETRDLLGIYTHAVMVAGLQHSLDLPTVNKMGLMSPTQRWAELDSDDSRSIGAGVVRFEVEAGDIVNDLEGPSAPPPAPIYEDPGAEQVETVIVTTTADQTPDVQP